jgi:putrescine aminotransferase
MKSYLPKALQEGDEVSAERAAELLESVSRTLEDHVVPYTVKMGEALKTSFVEWRGEGIYVYTPDGQKRFDCVGGGGVFGLGFAHPDLVEAVCQQARRGGLATRAGYLPNQAELAEKLLAVAPDNLKFAFFANSGTESVECAIKLARLATGRSKLIGTHMGYHGLSTGTISLSGIGVWRDGIGPYLEGTELVHHGDLDSLAEVLDEDTAAVVLEPIQWASGCKVVDIDYFQKVSEMCKEKGALLILDEVQTGLGRTGYRFALEHWNVKPDILCVGKVLSGGMIPISAVLYTEAVQAAEYKRALFNNSSYGGNPIACAAGVTTLNLLQDKYFERSRILGDQLAKGFDELLAEFPDVLAGYHGLGLMRCMEFRAPVAGYVFSTRMATKHNVIVASMGHMPTFVRVSPPFICTDHDMAYLLDACRACIKELQELGIDGMMRELEAIIATVNRVNAEIEAEGQQGAEQEETRAEVAAP